MPMSRPIVFAAQLLLATSLVLACSSDPASTVGGTSGASGGSSGDGGRGPRDPEYCLRYLEKSTGKASCPCGKLVCKRSAAGECECGLDPFGVDVTLNQCSAGPLSPPSGGLTSTRCCIGPSAGGGVGLCRCRATATCEPARDAATCDRLQLTEKELVPGNVIFEDARLRLTAMAKVEVDQWVADGRAQRQGANVVCNDP